MAKSYDLTQYEAAHRKRTLLSALLIFLAMPVTIFIGIQFDQNKYMIISVLLLIYTMLPFFMVFENRKPKAREIVLIAMMSALTVCVHIFFHITLPLQIGTAMIIISGISLGPEAGFLIGAISRFVCNFTWGKGRGPLGRCSAGAFWGFWPAWPLTRWIWIN